MGGEYYERLGVSSDASTEEIAAAYRERLKETHPDVSDASDAGERTKRLIEAKEVLTDETERARYDRLGHDRYVSTERGRTADAERTWSGTDEPDTASEQPASDPEGADSTAESTADGRKTAGRSRDRRTSRRGGGHTGGARTNRGVDWGTHTTRGVDWAEWDETDWEEVSEAVWEEVTGADSTESRHTATGWGDATERDAPNADGTGDAGVAGATEWSGGPGPTGHRGPGPGGQSGSTGHGRSDPTATDAETDTTATADAAGGASAAASEGEATEATAGTTGRGTATGTTTASRSRSTVGWYSGGDPSGTAHDTWSVGGSNLAGEPWGNWTPGTEHDSRYRRGTFPPHRILSPLQSIVLFGLCFLTYPLLVTGSVFPLFTSPVRLVFAILLVFVMALLIILPQLGVVVFGAWTVLFPVAFANLGVPMFAPESLLTMGAVLISLGLAVLSWLLTRPPVL